MWVTHFRQRRGILIKFSIPNVTKDNFSSNVKLLLVPHPRIIVVQSIWQHIAELSRRVLFIEFGVDFPLDR